MSADPSTAPGTVDTVTHAADKLLPILLMVGGIGISIGGLVVTLRAAWFALNGLGLRDAVRAAALGKGPR